MLTISSIVVAVLLNAVLAGAMALAPPHTPGKTAFLVIFFMVGSVLTGLFWHWFYGGWFREHFGLDQEYRRIDDDTLAGIDMAEQRQFRFYPMLYLLLFGAGFVSLGLSLVHYVQGSCGSVWECVQQAPGYDWFWVLFFLVVSVEMIETRLIKPRRRPPAASS
jgi:hypothetical protein